MVKEIFAYVATSPQGTGIATVKVGDQIWLPLVAERREELEQLRPVAGQLANVLQAKYESSINTAGVERSVQGAQKIRAVADSTRAANTPKSQVPLPGMPNGAAPTPAPQPTTPAPQPTKKP